MGADADVGALRGPFWGLAPTWLRAGSLLGADADVGGFELATGVARVALVWGRRGLGVSVWGSGRGVPPPPHDDG